MPTLMPPSADVLVIGGGPAGYAASLRAAKLGAKVVLIEKGRLGGACLNHACVPTKYLRYAGEILHVIEKGARYGITTGDAKTDWATLQERRQLLIDNQAEGMQGVLEDQGVQIVYGEARLLPERDVAIITAEGETSCRAERIIITTGSIPTRPNIPGADFLMSSRELIRTPSPPRRLGIIGGGPVGVELAAIFTRFGTEVSLIEIMPRILPGEDAELTGLLERELKRAAVRLYTGCRLERIEKDGESYQAILAGDGRVIEVDCLVGCTGQRPRLDGLSDAGLRVQRGAICVDGHLYTGTDGVYAAGDVTGKALLAYVATMQGRVAAENALGISSVIKYDAIPRCVFSIPELASVGLTEEEARSKGLRIKVGRATFAVNTAATIYNERRGLVKMVANSENGRLLGVHILGPEAPLLIHEAVLAIKKRATLADIKGSFHIHPSLAEAIWEAACDAMD
jgi:dihydrolipoamide dehydrogenase